MFVTMDKYRAKQPRRRVNQRIGDRQSPLDRGSQVLRFDGNSLGGVQHGDEAAIEVIELLSMGGVDNSFAEVPLDLEDTEGGQPYGVGIVLPNRGDLRTARRSQRVGKKCRRIQDIRDRHLRCLRRSASSPARSASSFATRLSRLPTYLPKVP